MKYVTLIALALFAILVQGCAAEGVWTETPPETEAPDTPQSPLEEAPAQPLEEDETDTDGLSEDDDPEIAPPIGRGPHPEDEDSDDPEVAHPIAPGPEPEEEDDDSEDVIEGHWVDGDGDEESDDLGEGILADGGDGDLDGEESLPGVSGGDDGGEDGDETETEIEIRGECEPGQNECDIGFSCEETCQASFCDEDGRCTQDCRIVYACVGSEPIPM